MKTSLTRISGNVKTGPIPVSTSSKNSCPPSCGLFDVCYGKGGPLNIHWNKVTDGERGENFDDFCDSVKKINRGQLWRHNQAGDLYGNGDHIDAPRLVQLTKANKGRKGFTYSHKPVLGSDIKNDHLTSDEKSTLSGMNREAICQANKDGFTINLSGNDVNHADKLKRLGIAPVATLVPSDQNENFITPEGNKVVICPATQRDDVTCASCGLCQKQRSVIVGFPAHGMRKRAASELASL
tara:strand:- start:116 stop:832 length:717 start_codon:yes stop_codon:yes gene_type:complete